MTQRKTYLDILRIIATFSVVVIHVSATPWYKYPTSSLNWQFSNVWDSSARFSVPIFFMISGILFLNPQKNITIKTIMTKYIKRIFFILIFWSIFYSAYNTYNDFKFDISAQSIKYFIKNAIYGPYHFWFLFVLIGLYLVTPILREIAKNEKILNYFISLSFIISIILPTLQLIPKFGNYFFGYIELYQIRTVLGYSFYFVFGYWLDQQQFTKKQLNLSYIIGFLAICVTAILTSLVSLKQNHLNTTFYDYLRLNNMLAATGIFLFIKNKSTAIDLKESTLTIINKHSKYSFGIFIIHAFVLSLLSRFSFFYSFTQALSIPLLSVATYTSSYIFTAIIYRLPKKFHILV